MKHIITLLIIVLGYYINSFAQVDTTRRVVQEGNTFKYEKSEKKEAIHTIYTWVDSKGVEYPIFLSDKKAFVIRTSKKTGKPYTYYLPEKVFIKISSEYNKLK